MISLPPPLPRGDHIHGSCRGEHQVKSDETNRLSERAPDELEGVGGEPSRIGVHCSVETMRIIPSSKSRNPPGLGL
jgi:hypothetical protein